METAKWRPQRLLHLAVLCLLALWVLWPLAFMLVTSFKSEAQIGRDVAGWVPSPFTWNNYTRIFTDTQDPIGRWFFNSAVSVFGGVFLVLLVASLAAYGLSRLQWPGRDLVFYLILGSTLIPGITFIIPLFAEFAHVSTPVLTIFGHDIGIKDGLLDTYWPIILVHPAGAFAVFMLRQFYLGIPRELEEAAIIDGAGKLLRWWKIIVPMMRTPMLTLAILAAVGIYNDFIWPLIVMQSTDMYTITVGISIVTSGAYVNDYGPLMAFSTVAAIPTVVLFIILQRHFVASAALSGVKG